MKLAAVVVLTEVGLPVPTGRVILEDATGEVLATTPPALDVPVSGVLTATTAALEAGVSEEVIAFTEAVEVSVEGTLETSPAELAEDSTGTTTSTEVPARAEDSDGRTASDEVPSAAVMGQIVVEMATVIVVRVMEFAGQSVTVGAQLMIVET